jgi:hypothetical protein
MAADDPYAAAAERSPEKSEKIRKESQPILRYSLKWLVKFFMDTRYLYHRCCIDATNGGRCSGLEI